MTPPPVVDAGGEAEALVWRVAGFIAARASSASERFGLCLSGGSTPKRVPAARLATRGTIHIFRARAPISQSLSVFPI
jgi:6-phosphogluconolactonase/glucosamine-6-phosphate isomerase/deaminase